MKSKTWLLLSLASILLIFCAVRAVRSPAASAGAQGPAVCENRAPSDENGTSTRLRKAPEGAGADQVSAANELYLRQLETAQEAQRMRQQEAASELQRRQQQAPRPLS